MARRMPLPPLWTARLADGAARHCGLPCSLDAIAGTQAVTLSAEVPLEGWDDRCLELELLGLYGSGTVAAAGQTLAAFELRQGEPLRVDVTALCPPGTECLPVELRFAAGEGARGMLEGAFLHGYTLLRIQSLSIRTDSDGTAFGVRCEVDAAVAGRYQFCYAVSFGDTPIGMLQYPQQLAAGAQVCLHKVAIAGAHLWQVGQENTPYTVKLTVLSHRIGCDMIQLRTGMLLPGVTQRRPNFPECLHALGNQPVFLSGATWDAPPGILYDAAALQERLALLQAAHIQCLLVPEPQGAQLYDACDRHGIMVWQLLPADPARAEPVIRRLMRHPAIVQWGLSPGGDEAAPQAVTDILDALGDQRPFVGETPQAERPEPTWEALGAGLCFNVAGPAALLDPEKMARYANADDAVLRVMSVIGPGYVAQEAADWFGLHAAWTDQRQARLCAYLRAETLRYFAERARFRGALGFFGGQVSLFGGEGALLGESSALTAAFRALATAYTPVTACARLTRTAFWAGSPMEAEIQLLTPPRSNAGHLLEITATLYRQSGDVLAHQEWNFLPCRTAPVGTLLATAPDAEEVLLLRLVARRKDDILSRSDVLLCVGQTALQAALLQPPRTTLLAEEGRLTNIGESLAFAVLGDGVSGTAANGWGALLPGESWQLQQNALIAALGAEIRQPDR